MRHLVYRFVSAILALSFGPAILCAATIGTVVPVIGVVSDLAYDTNRNLVYVANSTRNDVEIYNVATNKLTGSIQTGLGPGSLAISRDGNTLYVANTGSNSVTSVNLTNQQIIMDYGLNSRPDAIAVGSDGNVVILGACCGLTR